MKVAGLQGITTAMEGGVRALPGTQDGGLKELARLMRERARLTEERENWQKRIDRIDTRLARIVARETLLLKAVVGEDAIPPAQAVEESGRKERLNEVLVRY